MRRQPVPVTGMVPQTSRKDGSPRGRNQPDSFGIGVEVAEAGGASSAMAGGLPVANEN